MSAFGPKRTPAIALKIRFRGYSGHIVLHGICLLFLPPDSTIHAFTVESSRLGMRDGAGFLWTIWAIKAFESSFREHPIIDPIFVVPIFVVVVLVVQQSVALASPFQTTRPKKYDIVVLATSK